MCIGARPCRAIVVDQKTLTEAPILAPLARELAEHERLGRFAADLAGSRARVSEAALPLVASALHVQLDRRLVCLLPDDADARDAAEAAAWYLGPSASELLPSRGVRWESGLEPPPHLVGERARALDVLAAGGLVFASALALAEGAPPPHVRPEPSRSRLGAEPGIDALAEELALAGYERVDQVEERGQFAVRGGIVDVFPSTGPEPLRIELFGDEIEPSARSRRSRSAPCTPSTRRSSTRPPSGGPTSPSRRSRTTTSGRSRAATSCRCSTARRTSSGRPTRCSRSRATSSASSSALGRAARLDPLPQGQPFSFEAQRPAIAARGLSEAENELGGARPRRPARDRRLPAPRRGAAHAGDAPPRPGRAASTTRAGCRGRPGSPSSSHPPGAASSGASSGSRCCRTRRSSASARRAPTRACGRALQSFADLRTGDYVVHEDHGVGQLLSFETQEVAERHARLPAARVPRRGPPLRPARADRQGLALHRRRRDARRRSRSSAARPGSWSRTAPASGVRELAGDLLKLYAQRQSAPGRRVRPRERLAARLEAEFPYRETEDQAARDRGRQGGPRGAAADGPARLRRRRLRQDRGRRPRRLRGRGQRQADPDARPDDDPRRSSTGTRSASATATSRSASRWCRASAGRPR